MSVYGKQYAQLYDLLYGDKPYDYEAEFVHKCMQQHGIGNTGRILELACGTGNHAFHLEKLGYDVTAVDLSPDMIAEANRKAQSLSSRISFLQGDMAQVDIGERVFDSVICLFDSIGYAVTNEHLSGVLKNVHRHLAPSGLFIFEFWHAAAMLRHYEPIRIRRWKANGVEITRISETHLDFALQTAAVDYTVFTSSPVSGLSCFAERHLNRYFLLQEMELFLSAAQLKLRAAFNGFTGSEIIDDQTWHIVAVARRD
jgi:SAM-dependent methyltransferase